jgi:signal transduction histidine kinase
MKYSRLAFYLNRLALLVVAVSGVILLLRGFLRGTAVGRTSWFYGILVTLAVIYLLCYRRVSPGAQRVIGIAANALLLTALLLQIMAARHEEGPALTAILTLIVVLFVGVPLLLMIAGKGEEAL